MRKFILSLFLLSSTLYLNAQTTLFTEDFEGATLAVSSSSANGGGSWALNSNLQLSGSFSDSAAVAQNDSLFLETQSFDATNFTFMTLEFSQICKVDFFDKGIIEVSTNNGTSWTQLTSSEYTGSSFFTNNAFSAVSYTNWNIAQPSAIPNNTWWQTETFDLSGFVGSNQTKIRFTLIDGDGNGAVNNYGWLIDDIKVTGAPCELIPPTITLSGAILQGQAYGAGPFTVQADIVDASGVDTATLSYTINNGTPIDVLMTRGTGNAFTASISGTAIGDTVCYTITAVDSTTCKNTALFPSTSCIQFVIVNNPPPSCVGTPVFNYDYQETFASFTAGNGTTVGTLRNDWENDQADTHDWYVLDTGTPSFGTGPSQGHTPTDQLYMYVEASGFSRRSAILNTPCFDMTNLNAPKFSFWYHMNGNAMGELRVDIFFGGNWVLNVTPAITGSQGNQWLFREIDLTAYAGNIVKLRFRASTGGGFQSDIAIDDVAIVEPLANDIELTDVITPNISGCNGSANDFVTLKVTNLGALPQSSIPLAYTLNGGAVVRDTAFVTLNPGDSLNHTFQQTVNLSVQGSYSFDFWSELPNDLDTDNDSIFNYTVATSPVALTYPDTTTFDNFTTGIPGVLRDGWTNSVFDTHDWYVQSGGTPSNGTGPAGDNTSGSGNYLYIEATNFNNEQAILLSKCYDIRNLNSPELSFYYHMNGNTMGDLDVDILVNGILIQGVIATISGGQGNSWNQQTIDLTPFKGVVKIIFRGLTGNNFQSDIAIDDIVIKDLNPVGIEEGAINELEKLLVFPNPATNNVNISFPEKTSFAFLRNTVGQVVKEISNTNQGIQTIDVSELPKGVYFIEAIVSNRRILEKLIVE